MFRHLSDFTIALLYFACALTYVIWLTHLVKMAIQDRYAKAYDLPPPRVLPRSYFTWLSISVTTMFITGIAHGDVFIILTRGVTLFIVIFISASIRSHKRGLDWNDYWWRVPTLLFLLIVGGLVLADTTDEIQQLFRENRYYALSLVNASAMVSYFLFMLFGQGSSMSQIWKELRGGQKDLESFLVQLSRLANFALQAWLYAMLFGLLNSIAVASAFGAIGSTGIILAYIGRYFVRLIFGAKDVKPKEATA